MTSKNCVPFDSNQTYYPENSHRINETLNVFPVMTIPFVIYNELGADPRDFIYQICGPLVFLLKIFAEKQQIK